MLAFSLSWKYSTSHTKHSKHGILICGHLCIKHLDIFFNVTDHRWPGNVSSGVFDRLVIAVGNDIVRSFLKLFLVPIGKRALNDEQCLPQMQE